MQNPHRTSLTARFPFLLTLALNLGAVASASAGYTYWQGGATTNWSASSSWSGAQQTYYNGVQFLGAGASPNTSTAINNWLDSTTVAAQVPIWELDFATTNLNYTTIISPGINLQIAANNGNLKVGADILHTGSPAPANAVETITILGPGATLTMSPGNNNGLYVGQGSVSPNDTHNVTLDLSGLDNFVMIPPSSGNSYIYMASGAAARANGVLYLAKTNNIVLGAGVQMCNQSTSSNSQPVIIYLGLTNTITLGSTGNFNIGQSGTSASGAMVKFNPAFLGGATPPTALLNSSATGNRINNIYVCNTSQSFPSYGLCDLSGGSVDMLVNNLQVALSSSGSGSATGVLTFDMGTVNASSAYIGRQQSSGGGMAVGTVNVNSNSTYGVGATLQVNGVLTLAATTGTVTSGTAGTLNLNGGTLIANTITNGGGVATLNMTNATWRVSVTPGVTAYGNATVSSLNLGPANTIAVTFASPPVQLPATNRLVKYTTLGGLDLAGVNLVLPVSGSTPYQGYLSNNTAAGAIDLIITSGIVPPSLAWRGATSGDWDLSTPNWWDGTQTTAFAQADNVLFDDTATGTTTVNLTTQLKPATLVINNTTKTYAFTGSGSLAGDTSLGGAIVGGLTKQGPGTLILAHTGTDTYAGGVNISGGVLQVGDGVTSGGGNLGPASGTVNNNAALVFNRPDTLTVGNVIAGPGSLTNLGGTLVLAAANSFTGPVALNAGTVQLGNNAALGATTGTAFVNGGATLEFNGFNPGAKPIVVQGNGSGNGALLNSSSTGTPQLTAVTLAGDTTFGGSARWDLRGTLSANNYNVTVRSAQPTTYCEWRDLNAADLGNVDVTSVTLGWVGSTTAGTTGSLTLEGDATLKFYNNGALNVNLAKPLILVDGCTIANAANASGGANAISGSISLDGYDTFDIAANTSLILGGPLSGAGTLYKQGSQTSTGTLIITNASPAFSGQVLVYKGKVRLDGTLGTGARITTQSGTLLAGSGTVNGLVDVGAGFTPGDVATAGTFTCGSLTLESSALLTNNLSSSAGGANSRIVVNGDLTLNNGTIYLNLLNGTLEGNRPYTLISYSGNFNGTLPAVQTASSSVYTIVLSNATSLNPKQIQAIVTGGQPDVLVWRNGAGNAVWDAQGSANWSNQTTHASSEVFYSADVALLDDSITNSPYPATTISISGAVAPSVLTNHSTVNYTLNGSGKISDGSSLVKLGSGTLTISNANDFTGPVSIYGGTLVGASAKALGADAGTITITNGGTLDAGYPLGAKAIVVSGAGVGGNGAIVNNNTAHIYGSEGGLTTTITLMGDTTFGGTNRWDLGSTSGATLSTGGKPYNLSFTGPSYRELQYVAIDTNLADIDLLQGSLGIKGMGVTGLGNPTNTLTVHPGTTLTFWNSPNGGDSGYAKNIHVMTNATLEFRPPSGTNPYNATLVLDDSSTLNLLPASGGFLGPVLLGTVTLNGMVHIQSQNTDCVISNVISGPGGIYWNNYNNQLAFGAPNTYTGPTIIGANLALALFSNGSMANSTPIVFGGTDTNGLKLDVSARLDQTFTLASGQTLQGFGRINGALSVSAGATVSPGTNSLPVPTMGAIGASGAITLNGTTTLKLYNPGQNDVVQSGTSIRYGGTLNLQFLPNTLAAGNSWKLFNAPAGGYSGSFTLTPSSPGSGLTWDTSRLTTDGTLRVISQTPPSFGHITVAGGQVSFSGSNGPANANYVVLTTTNLSQGSWLPLITNQFDASGNFNWATNLNAGEPSRFYRLQMQ